MQTFLPYADFKKTAKCLDRMRLGKQRVEAYQILLTLEKGSRWINHPAVKMWKGNEKVLSIYGIEICREWIKRGYHDSLLTKFEGFLFKYKKQNISPYWLDLDDFHKSHQSNLLRKNYIHYSQFFSGPTDLPYLWPSKL